MNYQRRTDNSINTNNIDDNFDMNDDEFSNNYLKRNSDNPNTTQATTLINVNSGQPIGLDMNKFMNNTVCDQTVHSISTSNDLPIIAEVIYLTNN